MFSENLAQAMAQPVRDEFSKTVVLLKKEDCERRNGKVYMPNTIEMAKIKKPVRGQYKTNVKFSKIMGKDMVRQRLQEEFPTFDLMNVRFSCAAVSQDSITFQFHGTPCVWDGKTIKRLIKGNSVLYIVMEYDQMDVSSGISASDSDSLQDVTEVSSLIPWLQNNFNFDVECNPKYSPLQGGGPCVFTFTPELHSEVTSVYATFQGLGTQKLKYLELGFFPASPVPAVVNVTLQSQDGIILGKTQVTYGVHLQQVVSYPSDLKKFCEDYLSGNPSSHISGNSEGETENSRTLGCNQPVQMLSLLVYVAAEIGAQQFLEIMFTSSAGRVVFNSYKENLTLPEVIARDHGKEETASYLEDVTKRFSDETATGKEGSQTIEWCELMKAAEAAEKELDLTSETEDDMPKETGYLGDIDTSSSESSEAQSSDSDDDSSRTSRKETRMKAEECKQPVWQHKVHAIEANMASLTQSPILFLKDGTFARGRENVITYFKTKTRKWKENSLRLIHAHQETYNVREVKYLQDLGIALLLLLGNESIQHQLITTYQRLGYLLALSTERNAYYKMHGDTAEDELSLKHLSITVGNKGVCKASSLDALQQLCCRLINGVPEVQIECFSEFTATPNSEDCPVRRKSAECLIEHCQSTAPDFWVLKYIFRPTRKILFVYVADGKDVFPLASCFDDKRYELSWECQQWQRCENNVPKVQEICKLPAIPPEIPVLGRLALKGFKRALAEERTCDKRVPVMLIGQDRLGKTSLKKSLRGEPFNPDEKSTTGIEADPSHFKVSTEIWKTGEKDHNSETSISFEYHAARASVENLTKEKMDPSPEEMEKHDSTPKDTGNQSNRSDDDPESVQAFRYSDQDDSIPKYIETEIVNRLVNDSNVEDKEDVHSVLWDFAGQSVNCMTLKPFVKQGMYRQLLDSYCSKTNFNCSDFLISMILPKSNQEESDQEGVECEVLPEKLPPVFSVFIHADIRYESQVDPSTLASELFGSLQNNKPYKISPYDLFIVDNTISGHGSECPEVERLRQEILAVSKARPLMKEVFPVKWLKYEKELHVMKEGGKKCIVAARTTASEACHIFDDQELQMPLNFVYDKRILIHFSDTPELDKMVVLDNWLTDIFKEVIAIRPYDLKERKFTTLWNKLENDGILEGTLLELEHVCAPLVGHETFSVIREKSSLVCSWLSSDASCSRWYLMPSMLMSHLPESIMSLLVSARTPPLLLKFESGQVLLGLFPRLVLQFFQWDQEEQGKPHNFARFYTSPKEDRSVILLCHSSAIEIVVHRGTNEDLADSLQSKLSCSAGVSYDMCEVTCAHAVREKLGLKVDFCWLKNMKYEVSFICPVCFPGGAFRFCPIHATRGGEEEVCLHFWPESQLCDVETFICCTKSAAALSNVKQFALWFALRRYQLTVDKHNGGNLGNEQAIPPEITVLGRLALKGYKRALDEGKTSDKRGPVMLIGQDRSGKTSLKKSLRGEPLNSDKKSTTGIEVDASHLKVLYEVWKTRKKDHNSEMSISFEYHAARASVENLTKEKMVPSPEETEKHDSTPIDTGNQGNRSHDDPESVQAFRYSDQDDSIPKDIETENVKRLVNDSNVEDKEDVRSVLWDFAGQSVYRIAHPLFLSSRAIYLLVNDLSQNPSEKAKPVVKQGMYKKLHDSYCWKTNSDYLDFWMTLIALQANQEEGDQESVKSEVLPEKLPPVFLVCTHADIPYESQVDPTTLARELCGALQNKPYKTHLHDLLVVDNSISGHGSEYPEVVHLCQEILAVSKALPGMKEAIPIKWLRYEKELQVMKEGGKKCIDRVAARTTASEACNIFDDQQLQMPLNFVYD